jgi:hypothetical protein
MGHKASTLADKLDKVDTWQAESSVHLFGFISILMGNGDASKVAAKPKQLCWDACRSNASSTPCKKRKGPTQRREENLRRLGINRSKEELDESSQLHLQQKQALAKTMIAKEFSFDPICTDIEHRAGESQDSQLRMKFLEKLSYERIWIPRDLRPATYQTVIIFDWDDTLLCTSYLNYKNCLTGLDHLPQCKRDTLTAIEKASGRLLEMAMSLGQTFIITNALDCWVEYTSKVWAPSLSPLLQKVNVVSARSQYESQHPGDVPKWKEEAFKDVARSLDAEVVTNVVSVGDSQYEMDAAQTMGKEFRHAAVKLIKFRPQPSPEELLRQLNFLVERFECLVSKACSHAVDLQWCA